MGVHYGKTHAFVTGSRHMTSANRSISVSIHEHTNESVSSQMHLRVTIDKNLTREKQIGLVCKNASRKITLMKLLSKYVDQTSLKQYYNCTESINSVHILNYHMSVHFFNNMSTSVNGGPLEINLLLFISLSFLLLLLLLLLLLELLGETRIIRIIMLLIIIRAGTPLVSHSINFNWKPKCIDHKIQYILDSSKSGRNY